MASKMWHWACALDSGAYLQDAELRWQGSGGQIYWIKYIHLCIVPVLAFQAAHSAWILECKDTVPHDPLDVAHDRVSLDEAHKTRDPE